MTLVRRTIAVLAITISGVVGVNGQTTAPTPQTTTTTQQTTQTTTPPDYIFPTREERFKRYVKDTVGPWPLARAAASAGIQQWQDSPEEWGQGAEGYGKRFASNMGRNAIRQTVTYGLDSALGLDTGFQKSKREGFFPRFKDALIQNVTSRTKSGKRVVSVPRFAGVYTGSIVAAETWYPDRYSYKDGFRSGTTTLLYGFGINVVREFLFNW